MLYNRLAASPLFSPDGDPAPGAGGGGPAANPPADGGEKVTLSKEEYAKLTSQGQRASELEKQLEGERGGWKHVQRLMRGGGSPDEIAESVRYVMQREGYSNSEIEEYIRANTAPSPEEKPSKKATKTPAAEDPDEEGEPSELEMKVGAVDRRLAQMEYERLQRKLDTGVEEAIDSNTDLSKLISALEDPSEEEGKSKENREQRLAEIRKDVERETRDRLRSRRSSSQGRWNDDWIREEAAKAVQAVYSRYRTLVGDPARLGRTSETGAGEDRFVNKQPVKPPVPKKGMKLDQASTQTRDWALDVLVRSAHEIDKGGKTTV